MSARRPMQLGGADQFTLASELAIYVDRLTQPRRHVEPYQERGPGGHKVTKAHVTVVPSLLTLLRSAGVNAPAGRRTEGIKAAKPGSRPPAPLAYATALATIERGAQGWFHGAFRQTATLGTPQLESVLGRLVVLALLPPSYHLGRLHDDAYRWYRLAAELTGWGT